MDDKDVQLAAILVMAGSLILLLVTVAIFGF